MGKTLWLLPSASILALAAYIVYTNAALAADTLAALAALAATLAG